MTNLKEALRLVGQDKDDCVIKTSLKSDTLGLHSRIESVKTIKVLTDMENTPVHRIEYRCHADGGFLFYEFILDDEVDIE